MRFKENNRMILEYAVVQEFHGEPSRAVGKLARYSPGNDARNFFKAVKLPVDWVAVKIGVQRSLEVHR